MGRSASVVLPSSLQLDFRALTVRDEGMLTDPRSQRDPAVLDRLLGGLVLDVRSSPEFYRRSGAVSDDGKVRTARLLTGDRMAFLFYSRRLSYGDAMEFEWSCRKCSKLNPWEVDLSLLPIKEIPAESLAILEADGLFRRTLPDSGDTIAFRLTTGEDEIKMDQIRKTKSKGGGALPVNLLANLLASRIVEINGHKPSRDDIENLSGDDADWIRTEFDVVDCGVETEIEVTCVDCSVTDRINLPFGGGLFKRPSTMRRTIGLRPDEIATRDRENGTGTSLLR